MKKSVLISDLVAALWEYRYENERSFGPSLNRLIEAAKSFQELLPVLEGIKATSLMAHPAIMSECEEIGALTLKLPSDFALAREEDCWVVQCDIPYMMAENADRDFQERLWSWVNPETRNESLLQSLRAFYVGMNSHKAWEIIEDLNRGGT